MVLQEKVLGKVIFHSIIIGKMIRTYVKYIFAGFTIIAIFVNGYCFWKERKKDGKKQINNTE